MLAAVLLSQPAMADLVMYTTTGTFASSGGSTATVTDGTTVSTVSFSSGPGGAFVNAGSFAFSSLGGLSVSSTVIPPSAASFSDSFTLQIFQTLPSTGASSLMGTLSGTVSFLSSQLAITFSSTSTTIAPVTYSLRNLTGGDTLNLSYGASNSIEARIDLAALDAVTVAPIPAAAWAGIALLSCVAGNKLRLSRRASA